jgi:riboflavin kinase/FMN adenylyltransferase
LAAHAIQSGSCPVALTFSPHPRALTAPGQPPKLLVSLERRIEMLKSHGIKEVFVIRFDEKFAKLEALDFLKILCENTTLQIDCITVGRNWHFGNKGKGDTILLQNYCSNHEIAFYPVDELKIDGEKISSANIRMAITNGFLDRAEFMLGRNFELVGEVVKGFSFAGGKLGHPTANLAPDSEIMPPDGVYAAEAILGDEKYPAAVNIGVAPSFEFNRQQHRIEVHLLDFDGNLYGSKLRVRLIKHLRNERFFESAEALKAQIGRDIQQIRDLIK